MHHRIKKNCSFAPNPPVLLLGAACTQLQTPNQCAAQERAHYLLLNMLNFQIWICKAEHCINTFPFHDITHFWYILHSFLAGVFHLLLNRSAMDTHTAFLDIIYAVPITTWVAWSLMPQHKGEAHPSEKPVVCSWVPQHRQCHTSCPSWVPQCPQVLAEPLQEAPPVRDLVQ